MQSAIFEGRLRHRRMRPVAHEFQYRLFMMYLDLGELDTVFRGRWLWSCRRPAPARFRRADHFGDPSRGLGRCVRDLVERETGRRPDGPIRLLTNLSYFGYCFNPVSFYYCFDEHDETLETVVAEVNNTPWGERQYYVLDAAAETGSGGHKRYRPRKCLHVSPFMPMDVEYDWRFSTPGDALVVHMENHRGGRKLFDATLRLKRTEISGRSLARVLTTHPLTTVKTICAIYWQAFKLWLKRAPVYHHPGKENAAG